MFLLAITKSGISERFASGNVEEFDAHPWKLTIVFDNFLSKILSENDELSVIESPLISTNNPKEIVLSQAKYSRDKGILEISKPLESGRAIYYDLDSKGNFFCSTHISMLRQAGVEIRENTAALPEFFVFRFIMPPMTLYEDISQLRTGSRLRVKTSEEKCKIETINDFSLPKEKNPTAIKDFREKTSDLLSQSIQPLSACKSRLGLLLSGGLDSSLLYKTCQNLNFDFDTTYSTGYPFEDFEKEYAISAANFFGTNHIYHEITMPDYLRGVIEANSVAEQPLPHMQSVLLYLLQKDGIPKNKDIVLNGQGAELSCNRTGFLTYQFRRRLSRLWLLKKVGKLPIVSRWSSAKWAADYQSKIDLPVKDPNNVIWSSEAVGSLEWTSEHFTLPQEAIIKNPLNTITQFGEQPIQDMVTTYDLLNQNDHTMSVWSKIGESQKKIVYFPYNYSALVNYFFSIPPDIKFKTYKHVLKEVAHQSGVPSFIINRRKLGFNPLSNLDLLKKELFEPLIPIASKVFDEQQLRKVLPSDWGFNFWTLWNILNYSIWKRLWINNEPPEALVEQIAAD